MGSNPIGGTIFPNQSTPNYGDNLIAAVLATQKSNKGSRSLLTVHITNHAGTKYWLINPSGRAYWADKDTALKEFERFEEHLKTDGKDWLGRPSWINYKNYWLDFRDVMIEDFLA